MSLAQSLAISPSKRTSAALVALLAGTAIAQHARAQSTEPFPAVFELSSLLPANGGDGSDGFVFNGISAGDRSGYSVSSAGDANGDGFDDLIISAPYADPYGDGNSCESYLVYGAPGLGAGGELNLYTIVLDNGIQIRGIAVGGLYSYSTVSSAGDVNGDGFDDLIIGAPYADSNGQTYAGLSYVVFGSVGPILDFLYLPSMSHTEGFVLNGLNVGDLSGRSVSSAGDVNGDGLDDLIIGADSADPNGIFFAGQSYVVFGVAGVGPGGAGGSLKLSALSGTNGFALNGIDPLDRSGRSVSSAGDVNGDGLADLIIGAYGADPNANSYAGESYVVFGAIGVGAGGSVNLSSLNGSNGFVLNGIDAFDRSGRSVAPAGDVNGDGFDDFLIGARFASPSGNSKAGESYLVFGAGDLGAGGSLELSSLNGPNGIVFTGTDANDQSGFSIASAGDVNADGIDDLIIGALFADPNGNASAGKSYVVFGALDLGAGGPGTGGSLELLSLNGSNGFVLNGIDLGDISGVAVSSAGDINADGIDDLIIGATGADPNGNYYAGESYVVFGRDLAPSCPADLNDDGILDNGDINAFITLFLASDPAADFNDDGFLDNGDIGAFIAAFLAGC